jgi:hypothetical protein
MTRWTDFVKDYASEHNLSYGCALSKKACSIAYHDDRARGGYDMKEDRFGIADSIRKKDAKRGKIKVSRFR